jgi:hypothetical protein
LRSAGCELNCNLRDAGFGNGITTSNPEHRILIPINKLWGLLICRKNQYNLLILMWEKSNRILISKSIFLIGKIKKKINIKINTKINMKINIFSGH